MFKKKGSKKAVTSPDDSEKELKSTEKQKKVPGQVSKLGEALSSSDGQVLPGDRLVVTVTEGVEAVLEDIKANEASKKDDLDWTYQLSPLSLFDKNLEDLVRAYVKWSSCLEDDESVKANVERKRRFTSKQRRNSSKQVVSDVKQEDKAPPRTLYNIDRAVRRMHTLASWAHENKEVC